jgi:hypothetical protein
MDLTNSPFSTMKFFIQKIKKIIWQTHNLATMSLSNAKFNIRASSNISGSTQHSAKQRYDIQHNDTQHNDIHHKDTQRKRLICNTQNNGIQHKWDSA